ncbi:hypothetical protein [Psychroflexus aestuariivivens]|uniref:hypothetical protein n=1 Tax=Psychroflexus aestuariivivens TaxID=1795040 RepID=UPI000FDBF3C2|nr:hypothetical protein [Psychroflexus aestuariivivens]
MNTSILESKLKRHKISYFNENGKIIIGKPKKDYLTLSGLVASPIIIGAGLSLFMLFEGIESFERHRWKIIPGIVFLFGTGFFNYTRITNKKQANDNLKTLDSKSIKIKNEFGEYIFDSKNIKDFIFSAEQIGEHTYEGNLYLLDNNERQYQILGFDDENEKYILNDLKWFTEYFMNHVRLKETVDNI